MKKLILAIAFVFSLGIGDVFALSKPKDSSAPVRASLTPKRLSSKVVSSDDLAEVRRQRDEGVSAISSQVRDIEARYWARSILEKRTMMGTVEKWDRNTIGTKQEHEALVSLIKEYVRKGEIPKITMEELEMLDENKRQIRLFLNNGRENPAAAALARKNRQITEIKEPVFDIEARYWAWRIQNDEDLTYEQLYGYSINWVGETARKERLMTAIKVYLDAGPVKPLTKKEAKALEEKSQQVRDLLKDLM